MNVNYDEIAKIYDDVRKEDIDLLNIILNSIESAKKQIILDIGCGTGNFTNLMQKLTPFDIYGLDPSKGMLEKALKKNPNIKFTQGSAEDMPFDNETFTFMYMTDVIHHIPDINKMFSEIYRTLKPGGKLCIVTQSHQQIDLRVPSFFFPATATIDKQRYPDIPQINECAQKNNLRFLNQLIVGQGKEIEISQDLLRLVETKGYSMFHLISEKEYQKGKENLVNALKKGPIRKKSAGATLLWFVKKP